MAFQVLIEHKPNTLGLDERIWALDDGQGGRVEVWPARGFNAYRWRTGARNEMLHADPAFFQGSKPTRSGIPILFPFPNRIQSGRFTWEGKEYQLPLNDSSGPNAIHGFVHDRPWRVVDQGAADDHAWVTGEFLGSLDAPAQTHLWPADYQLRLTYRLEAGGLWFHAEVSNPDSRSLPFGLGFHPYFPLAPFGGEQAIVQANSRGHWQLKDNLPIGIIFPPTDHDPLAQGTALENLVFDDVFSVNWNAAIKELAPPARIGWLGQVRHPSGSPCLRVGAGDDYRFLVVFTPPHRQAVCLEPYTCVTNAINLAPRLEGGWLSLAPGHTWSQWGCLESK